MTREEAKKRIKKLLRWYLKEEPMSETMYEREAVNMAIEALSEPTISLSVIQKIHDAVDNAEPDSYLENVYGRKFAISLTKEHVNEIIDKAVKECTYE